VTRRLCATASAAGPAGLGRCCTRLVGPRRRTRSSSVRRACRHASLLAVERWTFSYGEGSVQVSCQNAACRKPHGAIDEF